jgi:predicted  nucleic acid-binding Zn-ribbon protein
MSIDRETIDRLLAEQDVENKKTLQQLKKYFGTEMDKCIDPDNTLDDAIAVLYFFKEKLEKEQPQAKGEISTMREAIDMLEAYQL